MILFCVLLVLLAPQWAEAAERILVGVAPAYIQPFRELAVMFEKKTAISVTPTFAATGQLYSQIISGAPYDLMLAADQDRPERLFREGRAERPFVYATGRLILWSARKDACGQSTWQDALKVSMKNKIVISNPVTSPYGAAAFRVLERAGLWEKIKPHLIYSLDVSQSFQFSATGGAAMAFTSRSYALTDNGKRGCHYTIEEAAPVLQAACIIKNTRNRNAADLFSAFLLSPEAAQVRKKYGYQ